MAHVAIVSRHAVDRARERCPELRDIHGLTARIRRETEAAFVAQRVSKRCPQWCRRQWVGGKPAGRGVTQRFVWDEFERRCYVVVRTHRRDDLTGRARGSDTGWIVVTTLSAGMGALDGVTVRKRIHASFSR